MVFFTDVVNIKLNIMGNKVLPIRLVLVYWYGLYFYHKLTKY